MITKTSEILPPFLLLFPHDRLVARPVSRRTAAFEFMKPEVVLGAMKASLIPEANSGLWAIKKITVPKPVICRHPHVAGKLMQVEAGVHTYLNCFTMSTLHNGGECVMHDSEAELRSHLNFVLRAHGHVLVTGLGLGCVVRGLLCNPSVRFITVIERSRDVLKLVYPYMPTKRVQIIRADALRWVKQNRRRFDCAYHDLWTDTEAGEPHLQVWHSHLLAGLGRTVKLQGAWAFPRYQKRLWSETTGLTLL